MTVHRLRNIGLVETPAHSRRTDGVPVPARPPLVIAPPQCRKLSAVLAVDVADFDRLMQAYEGEAHERFMRLRQGVLEPEISIHNGRVKNTGDGLVAAFDGVAEAVRCAVAIQKTFVAIGAREPAERRIALRMGLNFGQTIIDDEDIYGEGVNIAARLRAHAEPGDIVIAESVARAIEGQFRDVETLDLGELHLKNSSKPMRAFRLRVGGVVARAESVLYDLRDDRPAPGALSRREREPSPDHDSPEWVVRTLLFMDVVESVRLMEENESDVVRRWQQLVRIVENDILPAHHGRLVKSMGDGLTLEFPSVQPAVRAAFAIQHACAVVNTGLPPQRQMLLRMGAHVSHVVTDEHDVYGRGVNLAARLTTLGGPGEIVVSADVRDQLTPVLDADIEDLGACYLKHVREPVRAYRVGPPGPRPIIEPGSLSTPELRPTVAVIPFAARGGDPKHHVVGEVLADEIISALSHSAGVNVISRLSTTTFRGRDASIGEVGGYLNATYVLSGGYRVTGDKFRLTAELAAAKSGTVVWSEHLEGHVHGIVNGKDELIDKVVAGVSMAVMATELQRAQARPLPTLESYTLLMGAIALMHRLSRYDFDRAGQMLQAVTERASRQAVPWAWMARWHVLRVQQGWPDDPKREGQLALDCTRRALDADPRCSLALAMAGLVHTNLLKQLDIGHERYALALRVNPNDSLAWLLKGTLHAFRGEGKLAVDCTKRALKLSPLDPHRYFYDSLAATAALSAGQYKRAIELARRSLRANRTHTSTFRALAISQWQLGRHDDARKTVHELRRLDPTLSIRQYMERSPSSSYETGKIWSNALRQAGVPA